MRKEIASVEVGYFYFNSLNSKLAPFLKASVSNYHMNQFHGLPSEFQQPQIEIAEMMEMFKPFIPVIEVSNPLKGHSAEKALEKQMQQEIKNEETGNGVG